MPPSELYQNLLRVFEASGWNYTEVSGKEVIRAGFEAHHTRVELHVQIFAPLTAVSVVAESPRTTNHPGRRERLAEAVCRINQSLTVGNFELDWDLGRVFFRATNLFSDPSGDGDIIAGLVHSTVAEMDRFAPVEAVIHRAEGSVLASLDVAALLQRDDLLPEIPEIETTPR
jgi:hypothetical protein